MEDVAGFYVYLQNRNEPGELFRHYMKRTILILVAATAMGWNACAWNDLGHATIAEVAQRHLTPKAAKAVAGYLDGMKLASVASDANKCRAYWTVDLGFIPTNPDDARVAFLTDFDRTQPLNISPWSHSITVDENMNPYPTDNLDGAYINNDCYYVKILSEKLRREAATMDPVERKRAISLIVHFIGDMHCPVHIVYLPSNTAKGHFDVTYKGRRTNYHSFWDSSVYGGLPGGFLELAYLVDSKSKKEIREITAGDVYDWAKDSATRSLEAYELVKPGDVIPDTFPYDVRPLLYSQLRNAGYRLAAVLNDIFR